MQSVIEKGELVPLSRWPQLLNPLPRERTILSMEQRRLMDPTRLRYRWHLLLSIVRSLLTLGLSLLVAETTWLKLDRLLTLFISPCIRKWLHNVLSFRFEVGSLPDVVTSFPTGICIENRLPWKTPLPTMARRVPRTVGLVP